jgi:hypothetical protein
MHDRTRLTHFHCTVDIIANNIDISSHILLLTGAITNIQVHIPLYQNQKTTPQYKARPSMSWNAFTRFMSRPYILWT